MTTKTEGDSSASVDQNEDVNAAQSSDAEAGQQEANQSTDAKQDAGASSDAGKDGKVPAESSPAEGEKKPESLLDAMVKASKAENQTEKSPGSEGGSEKDKAKSDTEEDTDESEDGSGELNVKELEALKPKTRKRMEYLSGQVGALRPKAEAMDQLVGYVENAGLNTQEVNKGFEIMRLMKSDPFAALEQLRPYMDQLMQVTGARLPAHLQEQVNQGLISEAHAQNLVQTHTRGQLAQMAAERAVQEAETLRTNQAQTTAVNEVATAVSNWERNWSKSDPDYKAKQGRVQEKIELELVRMRNRGESPTRVSIVQLAQKCKEAVDTELKNFLPRRQPVNPIPNGQSSAQSIRQPKSMLDAMQMALNGGS